MLQINKITLLILSFSLLGYHQMSSQYEVKRIRDINPQNDGMDLISPINWVNLNNKLYFIANDGATGQELWVTDGTELGTELVIDINPLRGSNPSQMVKGNNYIYFTAGDYYRGRELWKTDGTKSNTEIINDINSIHTGANPRDKIFYNNHILYCAEDGIHGHELWSTDGTSSGTMLIKDINPNGSSYPDLFTIYNDKVIFSAKDTDGNRELWITDGTNIGTKKIKEIDTTGTSMPAYFTVSQNKLYFTASGSQGRELYHTDGTSIGTYLVKDIYPGPLPGVFGDIISYKSKIYFTADDGENGKELWESDGTSTGTKMLKDINTNGDSNPDNFIVYNGLLYFAANDGENGKELWVSDGTQNGTALLKDFNDLVFGFDGSSGSPMSFKVIDGKLIFRAKDGTNGYELWTYNAVDQKFKKYTPSEGIFNNPLGETRGFYKVNDRILFAAEYDYSGLELWGLIPVDTTGIDESNFSQIKIFPNPSNEYINIETHNPMQIHIVNSLGNLVKVVDLNKHKKLNVSGYKPGIYYIINKKNDIFKKIIIVR